MAIRDSILTILFEFFSQREAPWVSSDELRSILAERGIQITPTELSEKIEKLRDERVVEVVSILKESLQKGFIVRLTIKGRNIWVHGIPSLTGT